MKADIPKVSVVVCTRNRGDSVVSTLESVLANTYSQFEVILIDQSDDEITNRSVERFHADTRFRYMYSATRGSGLAHNIGMSIARGEIVAFTDDDCSVPTNWLDVLVMIFERNPHVAVAFCNVAPGPYDSAKGFIPIYVRQGNKLIRSLWDKCAARGIGAGMAVRREVVLRWGGFDSHLGPGGAFHACLDGDIAVRALLKGWWVYETSDVAVTHYGFRTWQQGKALSKQAWYGIGASYVKPLKCGYWRIMIVVLYEALIIGLLEPLLRVLRFKKPQGIKQIFYFVQGFIHGLMTPIDHNKIIYDLD